MNNFKKSVEATKKTVEIVEASKVAKEIKQYGGLDVYDLMKKGNMYAIVVDGQVIGGATSKKDAEAAVELLTHFTGGAPLCKDNLMSAGMKAIGAIEKANNLVEAEADGTIKIEKTLKVDEREYVIDDGGELYSIDGDHIGNISDLITARKSGGLTEELYDEILKKRIAEYWGKKTASPAPAASPACGGCPCCETITKMRDKYVSYDELGCDRDDCDECIQDCIEDWLYENYDGELDYLDWHRDGSYVVIDADMVD